MLFEIDHQVALPPIVDDGESSQGEVDKGGGGVSHVGGGGDGGRTNSLFRNDFPSGKFKRARVEGRGSTPIHTSIRFSLLRTIGQNTPAPHGQN